MGNGTQGEKKGLGPLAWIGIGCGAIVLVGVVVLVAGGLFVANKVKDVAGDFEANPELAAARMIVKLNPELEEVGVDEEAGTITIRETKTGKEITVSLQDLKEGKISFSSDGQDVTVSTSGDEGGGTFQVQSSDGSGFTMSTGNTVTEDIPSWVPALEGAEPTARSLMQHAEGMTGSFSYEVQSPAAAVVEFYRASLAEQGFAVNVTTYSGEDGDGGLVNASDDTSGRTVVVVVGTEPTGTSVGVNYNEKKP